MPKMFLCFSHELTEEQRQDAMETLQVETFIAMPKALQEVFSDVPPELESLTDLLAPLREWLAQESEEGDVVLVQGDYGTTYQLIQQSLLCGCVPVYATTQRVVKEERQEDGSVKVKRLFQHVRFRSYEEL